MGSCLGTEEKPKKPRRSLRPLIPNDTVQKMLRVLVIGDSGVGKSALLLRFTDDTFSESFISTIGVDFKTKTLPLGDKKENYHLQIWDTAGQERFRTITHSFYRSAQCCLVVFDVTNRESFESVKNYWLQSIDRYSGQDVEKIVVGNKVDLEEERVVAFDEVKEFCNLLGLSYVECSAKNCKDVITPFEIVGNQYIERHC
eukprot:TRINITY_DN51_c1_g1_i1.p1 TRINITY_DN51_c1_g1~~TRINITY_DN51_c1_g1_i1.p1  ORF type:complete len:200 (-),score=44.70 TRINITY_DN51_c1_g1_i1:45-644(-)